jgi:hypothetical protein
LCRNLGVTGLMQLQFAVDEGGVHHVLDLNPRFYGSMQLAIAAGADLPRLWAEMAMGSLVKRAEPITARPGVNYQWLEGDLRRSASQRDVRGFAGCLVHAGRAHHSIACIRDPRPAVNHALDLSHRARGRARRSL